MKSDGKQDDFVIVDPVVMCPNLPPMAGNPEIDRHCTIWQLRDLQETRYRLDSVALELQVKVSLQ
ncbi:MAG TPA: hypothetical protein V6C65_25655 [Allocoleopsis sp.]